MRGWTAYYGISQHHRPVPELDDWIRRRMRMCYWKQWRWVRTKIKNLLALGVNFVERADLLNRPLRTRMVGGVGLGARNPWLPD